MYIYVYFTSAVLFVYVCVYFTYLTYTNVHACLYSDIGGVSLVYIYIYVHIHNCLLKCSLNALQKYVCVCMYVLHIVRA